MGLSHVEMAMVQAEAAKTYYGPWVLNCQAPDEGNMHTLLHWATAEQKEKYLKPLCEGRVWSCFAMTEPEVAGSDPTLIQTRAYQDGDEWVINGHKWFISNARRANFAILVCRTEDNPDIPQAGNSAFIIDLPAEGWNEAGQWEGFRWSVASAPYQPGSGAGVPLHRVQVDVAWSDGLRDRTFSLVSLRPERVDSAKRGAR